MIVERFDTLPIWGMYSVPQVLRAPSSDHIVDMKVDIPRTCVGPLDKFVVLVTLSGNPDWQSKVKKVRVDKIVVAIEQIVTYRVENSFEPFVKTKRVAETISNIGGIKIFEKPFSHQLAVTFPTKDQRDKSGFLDKQATILPSTALFTTKCALYSIDFQVSIRATFKGARDMTVVHPIIASQYSLKESESILANIESSVYEFADIELITGVCGEVVKQSNSDPQGFDNPIGRRRTLFME